MKLLLKEDLRNTSVNYLYFIVEELRPKGQKSCWNWNLGHFLFLSPVLFSPHYADFMAVSEMALKFYMKAEISNDMWSSYFPNQFNFIILMFS